MREKNLVACEIQKEIYENYGRYRGDEFLIQNSEYIEELDKMLAEQSKYYMELDENFIKEIKEVITSKRKFWEGPRGSKRKSIK